MPVSFEEELQRNAILRCLYQNSKVNSIVIADADGYILHVNEAFSLNYGYSIDDLRGKHGRVLFTAEDQKALVPETEVESVKKQGVTRDRNYIVHRNGIPMWTDGESVLVKSDSGATYIFKIVQNLQEQIVLETFLRNELEFSDKVVSAINEGLLVINENKKILRANAAFYRILEIRPMQAEGRLLSALENSIFSSAQFNAEVDRTIQHRSVTERLFHYETSRGLTKVLCIKTTLLDGDAENVQVLVVLSDVTANYQETDRLQRSEQQFRSLIENSPVASCLFTGRDMIVTLANDTMLGYWGKEPAIVSKPLREVVPELKGQPFLQILDDVFTTGKTYTSKDAPAALLRDGVPETYYFDFTYMPLRDSNGAVYAIMNTAVEVTDRVLARVKIEEVVKSRTHELLHANEALLQSNNELKRSNHHLEEFAHAASHDLKEPIRKIKVFSSQLRAQLDGQLPDAGRKIFDRMNSASDRMGDLIDDLLLYSHVSERPYAKEAVNLNVQFTQVLSDLELDIQRKEAVIQVEPLPTVQGYSRQLRELFQNLLANSIKFSVPSIAPHIVITASIENAAGRRYNRISVYDNGIGFETEHAKKIFRMFARLHGRADYEGTGVGLSIALKVAENHNGFIRAESTLGKGATFHVYLPES